MKTKIGLAFLVAILAVFPLISADLTFTQNNAPYVQINGLNANNGNIAVAAGETYPVSIQFIPAVSADEVEVSAWVQGERQDRVEKVFYDLVANSKYNARLQITMPKNLDELDEDLTLYVRIESDTGNWEKAYTLQAQRQNYDLRVLLLEMDNTAKAGQVLPIDVVLKNFGRHEAEDTMVNIKISELGISKKVYFEDLNTGDVCDVANECDSVDSRERTIYITLPEDAEAGEYKVEAIAYTDDTEVSASKTLEIVGTEIKADILSAPSLKTFGVGEEAVYELLLVNTGNKIAAFTLNPSNSDALTISLSESVVIVPAGSSKTVKVYVKANREGTFSFAVNAETEGFRKMADYTANVKGKSIIGINRADNTLVALTIVLAIIFVVLVVILAVLLTRKSDKSEEFGENYY